MDLYRLRSISAHVKLVYLEIWSTASMSREKFFFVESGEEDDELDFEEVDMVEDECQEEYEMRSSTVLEVIEKGDVVALYSDTSFDLFYLCKVIDNLT